VPPPEVLVLGSGIVGLACARELRRRGLRVEVLEAREPVGGASGASAGILSPFADRASATPEFRELCRTSRDGWRDWLRELEADSGMEVEIDTSGSLAVALDGESQEPLAELAAVCAAIGEPIEELSTRELSALVPALRAGRHRAIRLPLELRVHPLEACQALLTALGRMGVAVTTVDRPGRVERRGEGVLLHGADGSRAARWLVVATGAWSGALDGLPPLPVTPVRGQIALLDGVERAAWPFGGALRGGHRGEHRYAVRRGATGLLIGSTLEQSGFAEHPTVAGIGGLLDYVREVFPPLAGARLASTWAGLRPGSPDGRPLIGPLAEDAGATSPILIAAGHFRNGILLAPWTARVVADMIAAGGREPGDWPFSPRRFGAPAAGSRPPL
jgi:glycine oxidase